MLQIHGTHCCGLAEIDNLGTVNGPEEAIKQAGSILKVGIRNRNGALQEVKFVIFTGVTSRVARDHSGIGRFDDYGQRFADYIKANGLGQVIQTEERTNVSTGNGIKTWVWTPVYLALYPFLEKLRG